MSSDFTQLLVMAKEAIELKRKFLTKQVRRAVAREIFVKQYGDLETELTDKIARVISEQVRNISQGILANLPDGDKAYEVEAHSIVNQASSPDEWYEKIVDATLPVLAAKMSESMTAYFLELGIDPRNKAAKELWLKFNPYHGPDGRFVSAPHLGPSTGAEIGGGGSGGGGSSRSERAKRTHKPSTKAKQRRGEAEQLRLSKLIKNAQNTDDNESFDVLVGSGIAIEVKTIMDNNNEKITMHPSSRRRKEKFAKDNGVKPYTVAIDVRGGKRKYYYKDGVGAFRLGSMNQVTIAEMKELFK